MHSLHLLEQLLVVAWGWQQLARLAHLRQAAQLAQLLWTECCCSRLRISITGFLHGTMHCACVPRSMPCMHTSQAWCTVVAARRAQLAQLLLWSVSCCSRPRTNTTDACMHSSAKRIARDQLHACHMQHVSAAWHARLYMPLPLHGPRATWFLMIRRPPRSTPPS